MPAYEYVCRKCGARATVHRSMHDCEVTPDCPNDCDDIMGRRFSFTLGPGELVKDAHYNASVGAVVSNDRELRALMAEKSERYHETTGIPMDMRPVDPREAHKVFGVTAEGLDTTIRRMEKEGTPVKIPKQVAADIGL